MLADGGMVLPYRALQQTDCAVALCKRSLQTLVPLIRLVGFSGTVNGPHKIIMYAVPLLQQTLLCIGVAVAHIYRAQQQIALRNFMLHLGLQRDVAFTLHAGQELIVQKTKQLFIQLFLNAEITVDLLGCGCAHFLNCLLSVLFRHIERFVLQTYHKFCNSLAADLFIRKAAANLQVRAV